MATGDTRLTLMVFPQRIDNGRLHLRLLAAPTTDPLSSPAAGVGPFADSLLTIDIRLARGFEELPAPGGGEALAAFNLPALPKARSIFEAFAARYPGTANPPVPATMPRLRILKVASSGYLAAAGASRLNSPDLIPADDYACAVHKMLDPDSQPPRPPATDDLTWNQIFARSLRQPLLAEALGLVRPIELQLAQEEALAEGGYIWAEPASGSPWQSATATTPDLVRLYTARLPRLKADSVRPLMAAVHFPVRTGAVPATGYDEIFAEADAYSDGFARIVHATQPDRHDPFNIARTRKAHPPSSDRGIRLGWDDEQLLVWLNRQLTEDPRLAITPGQSRNTPLGILGWRIDVREIDDGVADPWHSLVRVAGVLRIQDIELGAFAGELGVEIPPSVQQRVTLANGDHVDHAWLPSEGLRWAGGSLLGFDPVRAAATGRSLNASFSPVDAVVLRYGGTYEFRVRLMDLSGGGPTSRDEPINQAICRTARCRYRRFAAPQAARVSAPVRNAETRRISFRIRRPAIAYPDALYLPGDRTAREAALIQQAGEVGDTRIEMALPDADVTQLRIAISVGMPDGDPGNADVDGAPRRMLFGGTVVRPFPDDPDGPLELGFNFVDTDDVDAIELPSAAGDISLPTNRDIFLELTPVCRPDPAMIRAGREDPVLLGIPSVRELMVPDETLEYFGNQAARIGPTQQYQLREAARDESGLILPDAVQPPLSAVLIAPQAGAGAADQGAVARLAGALDLRHDGLTLKGRLGERTLLACASRVAHSVDAARAALTFATDTDVTDRWFVPIRLIIARDWSWTGLSAQGLAVYRRDEGGMQLVGRVPLPPFVTHDSVGASPQRGHVSILFLDVVERSAEGRHPAERTLEYRVEAELRDAAGVPPDAWIGRIRLPIATPPADRPAIASAGIAQSPYARDAAYSRTAGRERMLWLEFAHPPLNPADTICGRVLAWAPDPALGSNFPGQVDKPVPNLAIPDELVRTIVPDQPEDHSGADAMQPLIPTRSPVRFLVPLPPGLEPGSQQIFGFFRYEFRFAHGPGQWSTARARFGEGVVIDGIRHPPPEIECGASRLDDLVVAYAVPARPGGPDLAPDFDRGVETDIWFLLYGQAVMADGSDMRNVLLSRRRGQLAEGASLHPAMPRLRATWRQDEINSRLSALALGPATPLSVVAVELLVPSGDLFPDPLAGDLGEVSFLRASTLVPVPQGCTSP